MLKSLKIEEQKLIKKEYNKNYLLTHRKEHNQQSTKWYYKDKLINAKHCSNCNKLISKSSKSNLCLPCFNKVTKIYQGVEHPSYKDGRTLKPYYCLDCKKEISWNTKTKKCSSCAAQSRWKNIKKEYFCIDCHKKLSGYRAKRCNICFGKNMAKTICGKNHHCYKHGEGNFPYSLEFTNVLKESIRKRDNYTCQCCDMTEEEHLIVRGRVLEVHHIDYDKMNCKENNLITLCNGCNIRANFNIDYWYVFYTELIKENQCSRV